MTHHTRVSPSEGSLRVHHCMSNAVEKKLHASFASMGAVTLVKSLSLLGWWGGGGSTVRHHAQALKRIIHLDVKQVMFAACVLARVLAVAVWTCVRTQLRVAQSTNNMHRTRYGTSQFCTHLPPSLLFTNRRLHESVYCICYPSSRTAPAVPS